MQRLLVALALAAFAATLTASGAFAANSRALGHYPEVREVGSDLKTAKVPEADRAQARIAAAVDPAPTPPVGTVRNWLGLDDVLGTYYRKPFTLMGVGQNVEVWVANDIAFQEGDCRNTALGGSRIQITQAQVDYFINQFDTNIYPKESATFSVPPPRDGTNFLLNPARYDPRGDADRIVVLVDNVRDDNYYDLNNSENRTYIAGFFSSQLNELFDRNVMTIDAFDWIHRTGPNPPNEPVPGDNCGSAPARPFLYEGVFAHEYQHLLEYYEDSDEENWVNEGLSDFAETLTGYVDTRKSINEQGFDSHTQCIQGWLGVATPANPNPRIAGGPENSLTWWEDQGPGEILCDYGAAYSFMEFLASRYGTGFMSALHREDASGFQGLQNVLNQFGTGTTAPAVLHDWAAMLALDGVLDAGGFLRGNVPGPQSRFQTDTLHSMINWDTPEAYSTPGAPPNGSDYVRLRDASGRYLNAREITSLSFDGVSTLAPKPVEWTVDENPPGHEGDPALYSGSGNDLDRAIAGRVPVPSASSTLTFESRWNTELGWDFGFVQVSTDGGATYTSIPCTDTTSEHDPGAIPIVQANLPGFTGDSEGWHQETCSLAAYAGQNVVLAFRYITDPAVEGTNPDIPAGWWVDDIAIDGTVFTTGESLAGAQSPTQIRPTPVSGFTLQLVGYSTGPDRQVVLVRIPLDANFDATIASTRLGVLGQLRTFVGPNVNVVGAIVTYDDPSESVRQYACYALTVNGVQQPGGC